MSDTPKTAQLVHDRANALIIASRKHFNSQLYSLAQRELNEANDGPGSIIGWGETKEAAIADFLERIEERE